MITDRTGLLRLVGEMKADQSRLEQHHANVYDSATQIAQLYDNLSKKVEEVARLAQLSSRAGVPTRSPAPSTSDSLMGATRQMQEMNQSFNLQYLNLQQKMQQENRQYTMLSNIMKTKHDTAKASINNIR